MPMSRAIDWVFFDVGNVLMDERPWLARYQELLFDGIRQVAPRVSRRAFERAVAACGASPDSALSRYVLADLLPDKALHEAVRQAIWPAAVAAYYELGVPLEGIGGALAALAPSYHLGVVANQHPQVREWMAAAGLDRWFRVEVYDCEIGAKKPDPAIFRHALELAQCAPERAVMVGDRLDNDIAPAKSLGMHTVRLRAVGSYTLREPAGPHEEPEVTVGTAEGILAAIAGIEGRPV